ncbi:MAG TPA: sigma-54 dependent transcriptional regulator [Blastocatellia bacterium]|nr:sigma-54 dependent transcriptional regulator [Blastocatellia bacterium]
MFKFLVIEYSEEDAELLRGLLAEEGAQVVVRRDGTVARPVIDGHPDGFTAVFMLWDVADPAFAETLALLRHRWPETPVVVMIEEFTYDLATRAFGLGAKGVLQKPVEAKNVKACLRELPSARDYSSPMMAKLREKIHGESASLLAALWQLTRVIPHADSNVLLLGESGTGKELFARAIHEMGPRPHAPFVAAQVSAIHEHLFESEMFGHEKGAFTGADKQHIGFFEQAEDGTLFLDEIGDLSTSAQIRLLRVIQEKKFRRLNGKEELPFKARLVCATHHNLPEEVKHKKFRLDLYQRINEATILAPPLRERKGDIEALARYFLNLHRGERQAVFADETLKILCGYPFPGNVRELENIVKSALRACAGEIILPQSLPMRIMNDLLRDAPVTKSDKAADSPLRDHIEELIAELAQSLPADWLTTAYREAARPYNQAFDRVYLRKMLERHRHNLKAAAKASDLDPKTFRKYWKESGLPLYWADEGKPEE